MANEIQEATNKLQLWQNPINDVEGAVKENTNLLQWEVQLGNLKRNVNENENWPGNESENQTENKPESESSDDLVEDDIQAPLYGWNGREQITKENVVKTVNELQGKYKTDVINFIKWNKIEELQKYLNEKIISWEIDKDLLEKALKQKNIPFNWQIKLDWKLGPQTLATISFIVKEQKEQSNETYWKFQSMTPLNVQDEFIISAYGDFKSMTNKFNHTGEEGEPFFSEEISKLSSKYDENYFVNGGALAFKGFRNGNKHNSNVQVEWVEKEDGEVKIHYSKEEHDSMWQETMLDYWFDYLFAEVKQGEQVKWRRG